MCIDLDGHHSGGISFVYVNDFCYYRNCLYTHRYKFSFEKKTGKESQYIVSHPRLGSDPPFWSDRESGCDTYGLEKTFHLNPFFKSESVKRTHLYNCVFH